MHSFSSRASEDKILRLSEKDRIVMLMMAVVVVMGVMAVVVVMGVTAVVVEMVDEMVKHSPDRIVVFPLQCY